MSSLWTVHNPNPPVYCRPLGLTELGYYWDAQFEGTADNMHIVKVEVKQETTRSGLLSRRNIETAWTSLKCQYPLLGARIRQHESGSLHFFVHENDLHSCGQKEILYHSVGSAEEVNAIVSNIHNSPRILSDNLLACLFVFSRTDNPRLFHFLFYSTHIIFDLIGNATQIRTFLDNLARGRSTAPTWDIQERLALSSASEDLFPARRMSLARQRWRRAIGATIFKLRLSKISGGHTLPRKFTKLTQSRPAYSGTASRLFAKDETSSIVESCRYLGVSFGIALTILGQIAITRVLCRRYVRGEIDEEEWEFRKKEPMVHFGPINLRPLLDKEWYDRGGATSISLNVGYFAHILPFMPLGAAANIKPGSPVPSYSSLLSKERFRLRCHNIKKQAISTLRHPLLCEINLGWLPLFAQKAKHVAENWKQKVMLHDPSDRKLMFPSEQAAAGVVLSHGGSSLGCIDSMYPQTYPLACAESTLELISGRAILGPRPGELYLGASTARQQLRISAYFDGNSYEHDTVEEWLDEVREAINHFLVGHKSNRSRL